MNARGIEQMKWINGFRRVAVWQWAAGSPGAT